MADKKAGTQAGANDLVLKMVKQATPAAMFKAPAKPSVPKTPGTFSSMAVPTEDIAKAQKPKPKKITPWEVRQDAVRVVGKASKLTTPEDYTLLDQFLYINRETKAGEKISPTQSKVTAPAFGVTQDAVNRARMLARTPEGRAKMAAEVAQFRQARAFAAGVKDAVTHRGSAVPSLAPSPLSPAQSTQMADERARERSFETSTSGRMFKSLEEVKKEVQGQIDPVMKILGQVIANAVPLDVAKPALAEALRTLPVEQISAIPQGITDLLASVDQESQVDAGKRVQMALMGGLNLVGGMAGAAELGGAATASRGLLKYGDDAIGGMVSGAAALRAARLKKAADKASQTQGMVNRATTGTSRPTVAAPNAPKPMGRFDPKPLTGYDGGAPIDLLKSQTGLTDGEIKSLLSDIRNTQRKLSETGVWLRRGNEPVIPKPVQPEPVIAKPAEAVVPPVTVTAPKPPKAPKVKPAPVVAEKPPQAATQATPESAGKEPWQMTRAEYEMAHPPVVKQSIGANSRVKSELSIDMDRLARESGVKTVGFSAGRDGHHRIVFNLAGKGSTKWTPQDRASITQALKDQGFLNVYDDGDGGIRVSNPLHIEVIENAAKEGKPVPAEVLADYPDLAPKVSTPPPVSTAGKVADVGKLTPADASARATARADKAFRAKHGVGLGDEVTVTYQNGTTVEGTLSRNPAKARQGNEWMVGGKSIKPNAEGITIKPKAQAVEAVPTPELSPSPIVRQAHTGAQKATGAKTKHGLTQEQHKFLSAELKRVEKLPGNGRVQIDVPKDGTFTVTPSSANEVLKSIGSSETGFARQSSKWARVPDLLQVQAKTMADSYGGAKTAAAAIIRQNLEMRPRLQMSEKELRQMQRASDDLLDEFFFLDTGKSKESFTTSSIQGGIYTGGGGFDQFKFNAARQEWLDSIDKGLKRSSSRPLVTKGTIPPKVEAPAIPTPKPSPFAEDDIVRTADGRLAQVMGTNPDGTVKVVGRDEVTGALGKESIEKSGDLRRSANTMQDIRDLEADVRGPGGAFPDVRKQFGYPELKKLDPDTGTPKPAIPETPKPISPPKPGSPSIVKKANQAKEMLDAGTDEVPLGDELFLRTRGATMFEVVKRTWDPQEVTRNGLGGWSKTGAYKTGLVAKGKSIEDTLLQVVTPEHPELWSWWSNKITAQRAKKAAEAIPVESPKPTPAKADSLDDLEARLNAKPVGTDTEAPISFPKEAVWVQVGEIPPTNVQVMNVGKIGTTHWNKPLPRFILADRAVWDTSIPIIGGDPTGQARMIKLGRYDDEFELVKALRDGSRQPEYAFPEKTQRAIAKYEADDAQKAEDTARRAAFDKEWPDIQRRETAYNAEIAKQFVAKNPGITRYSPDSVAAFVRDKGYYAGVSSVDGQYSVINPTGEILFRQPLGDFKMPDKGVDWLKTDDQLASALNGIPGYKAPKSTTGMEGLADKLAQRKAALQEKLNKAPKAIKGKQAGMTFNVETAVDQIDYFLTSAAEAAMRKGISLRKSIQELVMAEGRDAEDVTAINKALPKWADEMGLDDEFINGAKGTGKTATVAEGATEDIVAARKAFTTKERGARGELPLDSTGFNVDEFAEGAKEALKTADPIELRSRIDALAGLDDMGRRAAQKSGIPLITEREVALIAAHKRGLVDRQNDIADIMHNGPTEEARAFAAQQFNDLDAEVAKVDKALNTGSGRFQAFGAALQVAWKRGYDYVSLRNEAVAKNFGRRLTAEEDAAIKAAADNIKQKDAEIETLRKQLLDMPASVVASPTAEEAKVYDEWMKAHGDLYGLQEELKNVRREAGRATRSIPKTEAKIAKVEAEIEASKAKLEKAKARLEDALARKKDAVAETASVNAKAMSAEGRKTGVTGAGRTMTISAVMDRRNQAIAKMKRLGGGPTVPAGGSGKGKQAGFVSVIPGTTESYHDQMASGARALIRSYVDEAIVLRTGGADVPLPTVGEAIDKAIPQMPITISREQFLDLVGGNYKTRAIEADIAKREADRIIAHIKAQGEMQALKPLVKNAKQIANGLKGVMQTPRTLMFAGDFSAMGVQGRKAALLGYLPEWVEGAKDMKGLALEGKPAYERYMASLQRRPSYKEAIKSGLEITDAEGIGHHEEQFASSVIDWATDKGGIARKITQPIKRSEYTYSKFLNELRIGMYDKHRGAMDGDPEMLQDLAGFINIVTGRGDIRSPKAKAAISFLSNFGISPRFYASQVQDLLGVPFWRAVVKQDAPMKAITWAYYKKKLGWLAAVAGITSALGWWRAEQAKAGKAIPSGLDWEFDFNPISNDIGALSNSQLGIKVNVIGNDVQWVRPIFQAIWGTKTSRGAYIEPKPTLPGRLEPAYRLGLGKAVPTLKFVADAIDRESYNFNTGEKEPLKLDWREAWITGKYLLPLPASGTIDATYDNKDNLFSGESGKDFLQVVANLFGIPFNKKLPPKATKAKASSVEPYKAPKRPKGDGSFGKAFPS